MRFCDFFIEYKIGLKNIGKLITWADLPRYRKIFVIMTTIFVTFILIFEILFFLSKSKKILILFLVTIGILMATLIAFSMIDSSEKNLKSMVNNYYSKYSYNRMNMLKHIFQKYNLDTADTSIIDLLIKEAEKGKKEDFFSIKKYIRTLGVTIAPIIMVVIKKIAEEIPLETLTYMALVLIVIIFCLISGFFAIIQLLKDVVCRENNVYNALIYDLRQLKIFSK